MEYFLLLYHHPVLSRSTTKAKVCPVLCYFLVIPLMGLLFNQNWGNRSNHCRTAFCSKFHFHKTATTVFHGTIRRKTWEWKDLIVWANEDMRSIVLRIWCFDNQSESHLHSQVTHSGCQNASHQQQYLSGIQSLGQSISIKGYYSWNQTTLTEKFNTWTWSSLPNLLPQLKENNNLKHCTLTCIKKRLKSTKKKKRKRKKVTLQQP